MPETQRVTDTGEMQSDVMEHTFEWKVESGSPSSMNGDRHGESNATSDAPPVPSPSSPFSLSLTIPAARNLFRQDDRNGDDSPITGAAPKTSNNKKKASGAAAAGSSTAGNSASEGPSSARGKKKKGPSESDNEDATPTHFFLTYTPFEPQPLPVTNTANADAATGSAQAAPSQSIARTPSKSSKQKDKGDHGDGSNEENAPPTVRYQYRIQTQLSEDALSTTASSSSAAPPPSNTATANPNANLIPINFQHTQTITSPELFLDSVFAAQNPTGKGWELEVWQYTPVQAGAGDKKKKGGGGPASNQSKNDSNAGSGAGLPSSSPASRSSKKKKGKGASDDDDDAALRFGELDPECVQRLGSVFVDLKSMILKAEPKVEGWMPVLPPGGVATSDMNDGPSTGRGARPTQSQSQQPTPEIYIQVELSRLLLSAEDVAQSNEITFDILRVERLPNWMMDMTKLEHIESIKAQQAALAAVEAGADQESGSLPTNDSSAASPRTLPLDSINATNGRSSVTSTTGTATGSRASKGGSRHTKGGGSHAAGGGGGPGSKEELAAMLAELEAETRDYTDSFNVVYNLPIQPNPSLPQRAVHLPSPTQSVGWSESQRASTSVIGNWLPPNREQPPAPAQVDESQAKHARQKSRPASSSNQGGTARRSSMSMNATTNLAVAVPSAGRQASPAPSTDGEAESSASSSTPPPPVPRGALLFPHDDGSSNSSSVRSTFLTPLAVSALKDSIRHNQPFLVQLNHLRTILDEKLAASLPDQGRIQQSALALVDLRPLLKPGATEMDVAVAVRQTSQPLPTKSLEETKKGANKRTDRGSVTAAMGPGVTMQPDGTLVSVPPETFDEAKTFMVMRVKLSKPLQPRRATLGVRDVLGAPSSVETAKTLASSFLSSAASASVDANSVAPLLAPPQSIPPPTSKPFMADAIPSSCQTAPFRGLIQQMVRSMVQQWQKDVQQQRPSAPNPAAAGRSRVQASTTFASTASTNRITPHALPLSESPIPSTTTDTTTSTSTLTSSLNQSGLWVHFQSQLRRHLARMVEQRFSIPLEDDTKVSTSSAAIQQQHQRNELYRELAQEVEDELRRCLSSRVGRSRTQSDMASVASWYVSARARFDQLGSLASYAELHGDVRLAHKHHLDRLAALYAIGSEHAHAFHAGPGAVSGTNSDIPWGGIFERNDVVAAWFEYGCFLLRQQNAVLPQPVSEQPHEAGEGAAAQDRLSTLLSSMKVGSLDGGVNTCIDLAEECFRRCLQLSKDASFVPANVALVMLLLEQRGGGATKECLPFLDHALECLPTHPLLLALQGLYHELGEEDEESAGAYYYAQECLNTLVSSSSAAVAAGSGTNSKDALLHVLLGAHASGAPSLPLLHSQDVRLMLARVLRSFGCMSLAERVLLERVRNMDQEFDQREKQAAQQEQSRDDASKDASNETSAVDSLPIDYIHYGPYLELGALYASASDSAAMRSDYISVSLLTRCQLLIETRPPSSYHAHSLAYAFAELARAFERLGMADRAADMYVQYLNVLEERQMEIYLDPVVLCRAASLYLNRLRPSISLSIATKVCRHPLGRKDPYCWIILSSSLSGLSSWQKAEECIGESLAIDERNGRAWGCLTMIHLKRIIQSQRLQAELKSGMKVTTTDNEQYELDPTDFAEASHAFEAALRCHLSDAAFLVELGRLWFQLGRSHQSERCYQRALAIGADEGVMTKLNWLRRMQADALPERELKAAQMIQRTIKGAIARKQVKNKKILKQTTATIDGSINKELMDEKEQS